MASGVVEVRFHRLVQADINQVLANYASVSEVLSDDFYEEFIDGLHRVQANPKTFHFDAGGLRRCNLLRFPYHFLYDLREAGVRVWVLRHDKQKPSVGRRRFSR